jgi:phosphatidylserine decarboxylase
VDDMGLTVFDRQSGLLLTEHIPNYVKVALKAMYRSGFGQRMTETAAVRKMLVAQSRAEGAKMNQPASRAKILPFIKEHQLDPSTFRLPVDAFENFNAFFYRQLKEGSRPIAAPENDAVAVSPADCRMTVFKSVFDATVVWIKGSEFTVEKLLGAQRAPALSSLFAGASLVIARLAPQDYHRFHAPVTGVVTKVTPIDGTLYTVNPIAVRQPVNVYTENSRVLIEIETTHFGTVVMIAVGATLVGSISLLAHVVPGCTIRRGEDIGYFAFGGSTTLLLFQAGRIKLDDDLVEKSALPMEVLVRVGSQIGVATQR